MKKFSVLIAHYNNYNYFVDCYKSILAQCFKDYEVIIVDDCSTDGSFEKIKQLTKDNTNIHLFKNEINKGIGYTKKKCINLANGDICGFLDPDDAIAPTAIEDAVNEFIINPDYIAVYSKVKICDSKLIPIRDFEEQKQIKNNNHLFFNVNFEVNHFFTFRKSAYNKTSGIDEKLSSAVDQDLYLKLYDVGKFKFIDKSNYLYRIHEKGISQEITKKNKLNLNWQSVLINTCHRRNIKEIYGKKITDIDNLPFFIKKKKTTLLSKIKKRLLW